MVAGDGVLICFSGDQAGIYAIAEIIESSKNIEHPADIGYWIDTSRAMNRTYFKIRNTCKCSCFLCIKGTFYLHW
ncbi:hypothetical protein [Nostoc sp.]|uniref:hypothetical protein n=1 Tax=Nostoc sp. TaxID=1180 RepID=UPI002FF846B7